VLYYTIITVEMVQVGIYPWTLRGSFPLGLNRCSDFAHLVISDECYFKNSCKGNCISNQLRSVRPLRFTRSQTPLHPNFNPNILYFVKKFALTCTGWGLPHPSCHPFETSHSWDVSCNITRGAHSR